MQRVYTYEVGGVVHAELSSPHTRRDAATSLRDRSDWGFVSVESARLWDACGERVCFHRGARFFQGLSIISGGK